MHSLALPFFQIGMKTELLQSCGHCWVFQICWHIECSTFTASSFKIWKSSTGIPSPPLALFVVMLATAKSLQSCPTLCNPRNCSPPGSPIPEFCMQEHWSGLPFPSPVHENEKWKWSRLVLSDSLRPHGLQPTRLLRPWDFLGKSTGVGCCWLLLNCTYILQ